RLKKISLDEESLAIAEEATALLDNMSYIISMLEEHPTSQKEFENQSINFSNKLKKIINSLEETVITQSLTTGNLEGEMEVDLDDILIRMSIKEIKKILDTDILKEDNLKFEMLQSVFNNEFNSQISNLTSNNLKSTISFTEVNNNSGKLVFIEDVLDREASTININREFVRPIFIDDPTVIDEISESIRIYLGGKKLSYNHKSYLIDLLKQTNSDENVFSKKKNDEMINAILKEVIDGNISINGRKSFYEIPYSDRNKKLSLSNLSTGMKSFSILSILKNSGAFNTVEYVILDEPEIHLHPEWQLKYAELIVLLSKYLNIKFLVTSHSPYFIEAIELFSMKHGIEGKVNYYKSKHTQNPNFYTIEDYTQRLSDIYDELAESMFDLQNLRDELELEEE
ncbi:hypothetical protein QI30_18630, partial [Kurthia sp. 3B1D]